MKEKYEFKLFITAKTPASQEAIKNLKKMLEDVGLAKDCYIIDVVDVLEHPELAETEGVVATPTLVKKHPLPVKKIVGNLSDKKKILVGLEIVSYKEIDGSKG